MTVMENAEQSKTRRSFTKEFKADAVSIVLDEDRSIADVDRSLDVGRSNTRELGSSSPGRFRQ